MPRNYITVSKDLEDCVLLEKIKSGCKQSFNLLYEKHWQFAFEDALKRLKDTEQSKDIVQEIFTHIWQKREELQIENLRGYLHIAVRNRVLKLVEKQKKSHPFFKFLEELPEREMNSDSPILAKENLHAFNTLLNNLPPQKQIIFRLRFQEELNTRDIARLLRISRKTVQNQLGKAVQQLKITLILLLVGVVSLLAI